MSYPFLGPDQQADLVNFWRSKLDMKESHINQRLLNISGGDPIARARFCHDYLMEAMNKERELHELELTQLRQQLEAAQAPTEST